MRSEHRIRPLRSEQGPGGCQCDPEGETHDERRRSVTSCLCACLCLRRLAHRTAGCVAQVCLQLYQAIMVVTMALKLAPGQTVLTLLLARRPFSHSLRVAAPFAHIAPRHGVGRPRTAWLPSALAASKGLAAHAASQQADAGRMSKLDVG